MGTVLRRLAGPTAAALLLAGISGCGGGDDEPEVAAPTPVATPFPTVDATPATTTLKPVAYADPFAGARATAAHMPDLAETLAGGFAEATKATGADTEAAELVGDLQHLFTEYVFLTALAMDIELVKPDDPRNADALAAVDKHAVALADRIGTLGTTAQRAEFLKDWRTQSEAMMEAAISNDLAVDAAAKETIAAYPKKAARVLGRMSNGKLDTDKFATALGEQLSELVEAHQAVKNRQDNAYRKLYGAAGGMSTVAATLATALAEGNKLAGDPNAEGAAMRGKLSHLLTSHAYLAATAVLVNYSPPGVLEVESSNSVAFALGDNSTDLTDTIGTYAPDFRTQFDQSWAAHINDVIAYSKAAQNKDNAGQTRALAALESYRTEGGKLFAEATKDALKPNPVAKSLETHIESLVGTVDALAKRMFG
jgi:hypothetical protein